MIEKRYIAIEGPIGVGKTSLAKLLGQHLNAQFIFEDLESNPFLDHFYTDQKRYAFQTQVFFLLNRFKQQKNLIQQELFKNCLISDYIFARDRIFALLNLNETELNLYEEIFSLLKEKIMPPDLVIYLQANTATLKKRIQKRARTFELHISQTYLENLNNAFNNFFFYYNESPVLIVDTTKIDYVKKEEDLIDLIKKILSAKNGKEYYIPAFR